MTYEASHKDFLRISVIICVYNAEKYLEDCLDSVLSSEYPNFEIIIVNDASTDNSKVIIERFIQKSEKLIYIENKENLGLTRSLNKAILQSKSDIIVRCDADDLQDPKRLFFINRTFIENPQLEFVFSRATIIDSGGRVIKLSKKYPKLISYIYFKLIGNIFIHGTMSFLRTKNGVLNLYNERYYFAQDFEFIYKRLKYFNYVILNDDLYSLRVHGASISANNNESQFRTILSVIHGKYFVDGFNQLSLLEKLHYRILKYIYFRKF